MKKHETLAEFYGLQFVVFHNDTCTCNSPRIPIVEEEKDILYQTRKIITQNCYYCGLMIHPRLEKYNDKSII